MSYFKYSLGFVLAGSLFALVAGCGTSPPPRELLTARDAYLRAQQSPNAALAPAQLHVAKQALDQAEKAYADNPDDQETRDLAYIAARRAQMAEAQGGVAAATRDKTQAEQTYRQQVAQMQQAAQGQLSETRQEREAAEAKEAKAKEAIDKLNQIASVREESRGTVITLPGNVLFASGKSTLLPAARSRLDEVAHALKEQGDRSIVVEGHTDAQGSDKANLQLSLKRAQSVVDYLIQRGVPADRIHADGRGESQPVADNNTAEGRANNRRVEIVVGPARNQ